MNTNAFALRHIGPREEDQTHMLQTIGVDSLDQLIYETIPTEIRLEKALDLDDENIKKTYKAERENQLKNF